MRDFRLCSFALLLLASGVFSEPIDKSAFFDDYTFPLIDKNTYGHSGAQRSAYAVHVVFIEDCEACVDLLAIASNASRTVAERRTGAHLYAINASNRDTATMEGELGDAIAKVITFPAIFITHFGRVNREARRIPRHDADALATFVYTMSKPSSVEITTAKQYRDIVVGSKYRMTIVVGYYTDGQSVYRLTEVAEGFRGLVNFYHLSPTFVESIQKEAALPVSEYGPIRSNTFVVFKQRGRGGVDTFTEFADRANRRAEKKSRPAFDPLKADQAYAAPAKKQGTAVAPEDIKRGGATSWYLTPIVDYNVVHESDGCLVADACMLHTRNRTQIKQFLSVVAFPPVDVLTSHNRDHYNIRTPNLVIMFSRAVSLAEADARMHLAGGLQKPTYTLHDERALLLQEATAQIKYMVTRFEQLSDKFPSFTFLFAGIEDNAQIFSQFGFNIDDYEKGSTALIGAASGDRKYVFQGGTFSPALVEAWLESVLAGTAEGFEKSAIGPERDPEPGSGDLGLVVYHTIHRVTNSRLYDSVVFFAHEPQSSEYGLRNLAAIAADEVRNTRLNILVFDGLDNDPPAGFEFEVLPALFFARFNETTAKNKIEIYKGDFSVDSIAGWMRTCANWPLHTSHGQQVEGDGGPTERHYPPDGDIERDKSRKAAAEKERAKKLKGQAAGVKTFRMDGGKVVATEDPEL